MALLLAVPLGVAMSAVEPSSGQDPDGRIPRLTKPEDLPDPDRWRYLPPGRVPEGDFIDRFGITSFTVPIVFSEEAVGTGAGVGLIDTDFRHQDRREVIAGFVSATSLGQEQVVMIWQRYLANRRLPGGGVLQREDAFIDLDAGYRRTLTTRFFGLGPDTAASAETSYTDKTGWIEAGIQGQPWAVVPSVCGSLALRFQRHDLAEGQTPGVPTSQAIHPELISAGDGVATRIVRTGLAWDSRDSPGNPYRGFSLGITADTRFADRGNAAVVWTVSGTATQAIPSLFHDGGLADLRERGPEENPPTDVIAVGWGYQQAAGDIPFYDLPSLGGSKTLRGYLAGRFVDRAAWHLSAEWRTWILSRGFGITRTVRVERLGLAPFVDVGRVGGDAGEAFRGRAEVNPGLSLRLALERALVFRLDVARSNDQVGVNFDAGMAF